MGQGGRAGLALAIGLLATSALASPTDPVLVLDAARSAAGTAGSWVRVDGVLPGDDLVQVAYPLQLVIQEQGTNPRFVRYDLSGGIVEGQSGLLDDGLDPTEAAALLLVGSAAADGAITGLGTGRIEVMLPTGFPSGPAQAQLFVLDDEGAIVSNAIDFTIAGATP
jgi:hypothetical protein